MKKVLLCVMALLRLAAHAGKITMSNPDEQILKGGKRLCTYENSIYLFTLLTRSQSCPFSKVFDTNDNEKLNRMFANGVLCRSSRLDF